MKIEPRFRKWLLSRDPARPDPYGVEQQQLQALVDKIEAATTEDDLQKPDLALARTWPSSKE